MLAPNAFLDYLSRPAFCMLYMYFQSRVYSMVAKNNYSIGYRQSRGIYHYIMYIVVIELISDKLTTAASAQEIIVRAVLKYLVLNFKIQI